MAEELEESERDGKAAICTDARLYNVFTFLDDEGGSDGEERGPDYEANGARLQAAAQTRAEGPRGCQPPGDREGGGNGGDLGGSSSAHEEEGGREKEKTDIAAISQTCTLEPSVKRKIIPNLDLFRSDDLDLTSAHSHRVSDYTDIDAKLSGDLDLDPPDSPENSTCESDISWRETGSGSLPMEPIPEYTAREEFRDNRNWRIVEISERTYRVDMRAIEPYKKVLAHGGYYGNGGNAIVVFTACHLPERHIQDYQYIMDNLFLYVVSTLELLIGKDYIIAYFHAATCRAKFPGVRWLKRCYDMIDHRLRKNLCAFIVVHPTLFLKTVLMMIKPFVSSKFAAKMRYVKSLAELTHLIPTEYIFLPEEVLQ